MAQITFLVVSGLVVLILVCVMTRDRKRINTTKDFFLFGEKLKLSHLVGTLVSSNMSLGNMVFVCAILGYFYGYSGVFWVVVTIVFLTIGFCWLGPRFKEYIQEFGNFGTLHDFMSSAHGGGDARHVRNLKRASVAVTALSLLMAIILEAHLGTLFVANFFGVPQAIIVTAFILLVAAYTASAGFMTVVTTDIIQFALMTIAIVAGMVLYSVLPSGKTFSELDFDQINMVTGLGWPTSVGLIVLGLFWLVSTPDSWQRNAASRSLDTSVKGAVIGGAIMAIWVALFALGGMWVHADVEPLIPQEMMSSKSGGYYPFNDLFLLDFEKLGTVASIAAALIGVGLMMAAVSTIDTFLIVLGHAINVDIWLAREGVKSLNELSGERDKRVLLRGRVVIVLSGLAILSGWGILEKLGWLGDPLALFFVVYTTQFCVTAPVIAATIPHLRSYNATVIQIWLAAVVTVSIGAWAMANQGTDIQMLGLKASDWLGLLPVVPILIGICAYAPMAVMRQRGEHRSS